MSGLRSLTGLSADSLSAIPVRWHGRDRRANRLQAEQALDSLRRHEAADEIVSACWDVVQFAGAALLNGSTVNPNDRQTLLDARDAAHRLICRQR